MSRSTYFEDGLTGYGGEETFVPWEDDSVAPPTVPVQPAAPETTPSPASATTIVVTAPSIPMPTPVRAPTSLPVPVVAAAPSYEASDYGNAALALFPYGRAWPRDPQGVQAKVCKALGATLSRVDGQAGALLGGSLPGARSFMLPEWEATLGLPDPCLGPAPSIELRCAQVRARFTDVGGTSRARYIAFAAALGFEIELVIGPAADFTIGVRILSSDGTISSAALMCELRAIAPAEVEISLLS
jgi:uncharacterized protein YmfQ (DUF2313 family)